MLNWAQKRQIKDFKQLMRSEFSVFETVLLIFAAYDEMALGALRAVKSLNMSIPVFVRHSSQLVKGN
jgi:ABC-type sugar transport system substrate-binding protein